MSEHTLEPPDLGASFDLSSLGGACDDTVRVSWAQADGRRVVVKSGRGGHRARLRREAEALRCAAGPGIVTLLAAHDDEDETSLILDDAGHRTLADPGQLGTDELLRALGRTCDAVARLHDAGWSHGSLRPEHVIVGPRGSVQLCSLSVARPIGAVEEGMHDVAALLELGRAVADELRGRDRHDARSGRRLRATLAGLEEVAGVDAERIAARLAALRGTGPRGRANTSARRGERPRLVQRTASALSSTTPRAARTATVSLVLVGLGTLAAVAFPGDGAADPMIESLPGDPPDAVDPGTAPAEDSGGPPTLVVDGRTYRVGVPGDRVAIGDWDCDGRATVRLLRPSTGELLEFGPADPSGAPTRARLRSLHPGAVDLLAAQRPDAAGCHRSVLLGPDDRRQEIP